LISENEEDLIQTIRSRCQILHFNGLSEPIITEALVAREDQSKHMQKSHISTGKLQRCIEFAPCQ
jgi:DNA polymerase III delta prime subunit